MNEKKALELDGVLKSLPYNGSPQIYSFTSVDEENNIHMLAANDFVTAKELTGNKFVLNLTSEGKSFVLNGGFIKQLADKKIGESDKILQRQSWKAAIRNSTLALIVSILAFLFSLREYLFMLCHWITELIT
ncbi:MULTISPECIES: hypothetical protein [Olivibacter]|uniref:Uncharacterized protein n=1 Tax=Olivibacter jilunii TaxID=985016 RepID=A0ABW6B118_9SPHI|nr:hypothetical protein [Pseudosphingobacterium sp.]